MANWAFLNNKFIAEEDTALHFKDLSFQRGYGIFDFLRLAENEPVFLEDHLDRFFASAADMHLNAGLNREELTTAILDLVQKNNLPHSGVRLSLTGGYSEDGFSIGRPNLLLSQQSFALPTTEQVQAGIRLLSHSHQRQLPHVKSIDYLMAIWLQPKRVQAGADDILYQQQGLITECPRSNFFLVTAENKIVTPIENVLAGITRKKVLELACKEFTVEERPVSMQELQSASEAFITSTTKQILPVAQIDNVVFPRKEVSIHLLQRFRSVYMNS